jgi:hypothetical protein
MSFWGCDVSWCTAEGSGGELTVPPPLTHAHSGLVIFSVIQMTGAQLGTLAEGHPPQTRPIAEHFWWGQPSPLSKLRRPIDVTRMVLSLRVQARSPSTATGTTERARRIWPKPTLHPGSRLPTKICRLILCIGGCRRPTSTTGECRLPAETRRSASGPRSTGPCSSTRSISTRSTDRPCARVLRITPCVGGHCRMFTTRANPGRREVTRLGVP